MNGNRAALTGSKSNFWIGKIADRFDQITYIEKYVQICGAFLRMIKKLVGFVVFLLTLAPLNSVAQTPPLSLLDMHTPNAGQEGVVVAEEELAASVGAEILKQGGNAVDAAVATGFALAVTYPNAGNIGGGGFMLFYEAETGQTIALDYRETAPAAATRNMYIGDDGEVDPRLPLFSHKSAGVPGTVAGLLYIHERFGRLPREAVLAPSIQLAEQGFPLRYYSAADIEAAREHLVRDPDARALFFKSDGSGYLPGELWSNPDLAKVLREVSENGRDGFYKGWVAEAIAADMQAHGGLITGEDLANYEPAVREPVVGTYRGYEVVSMPPPSSGGVHLIQMLNMLETLPAFSSAGTSAQDAHWLAEIMRRAYADRAEHLGDPDFVDVPVAGLTSKTYAKTLMDAINPEKATPSSGIGSGNPAVSESRQTTHFSIIDRDGNMIANTYTLNLAFGSGIVVPGTGMLLNNEMDDFSSAPGQPNYYGLVGDEKNAIAPGKRPLSSMTPTLVFKDGEPRMSVGAVGGSRIITTVFNIIVNVIDREMNIADAIDSPRMHHQWLPDKLFYEPGLSDDTIALLESKGHLVEPLNWYARAGGAMHKEGWFFGYADTRTPSGGACTPDAGC